MNGFLIESHPFNILAFSSVLLLKRNSYPADLLEHFSLRDLRLLENAILKGLIASNYKDIDFNKNLKANIHRIVKNYMKIDDNKIQCIKDLTSLLECDENSDLTLTQNNILLATINYVEALPDAKPTSKIREIELCVSRINQLVSNLFRANDSCLRWASQVTEESRLTNEDVNKRRRPDAIISETSQGQYGYSKGFGEVKTEEAKKYNGHVVKDLVRLATFGKQALDLEDVKANIHFQSVGPLTKFYLQSLVADGMYCMVEFEEVRVPMWKDDLLRFVDQYDKLQAISCAFNSCRKSMQQTPSSHKRQTLDSPAFQRFVNSKHTSTGHVQLSFD